MIMVSMESIVLSLLFFQAILADSDKFRIKISPSNNYQAISSIPTNPPTPNNNIYDSINYKTAVDWNKINYNIPGALTPTTTAIISTPSSITVVPVPSGTPNDYSENYKISSPSPVSSSLYSQPNYPASPKNNSPIDNTTASSNYALPNLPSTPSYSSNVKTSAYPTNPSPLGNITSLPTKNKYETTPLPNNGCTLPNDPNIVPITPDQSNKGWAMSPDQQCKPNSWCPYACKSGYYSSQWDPESKCANGPSCGSLNGGLFCSSENQLVQPFPDLPLCSPGLNNVNIQNTLSRSVSFCQTVYPGNEAMIIPTVAQAGSQNQIINSPPSTYWQNTSAQYYVNPPGSTEQQCIWGTEGSPYGNWAPYIVGIGQGYQGNTYVSLTVNPNFEPIKQSFNNAVYKIQVQCQGCSDYVPKTQCFLDVSNNECNACTITISPGAKAIITLG